jgi:hypothetical protein
MIAREGLGLGLGDWARMRDDRVEALMRGRVAIVVVMADVVVFCDEGLLRSLQSCNAKLELPESLASPHIIEPLLILQAVTIYQCSCTL